MEIKGYTLHGDYYLADKVIPNKTWKEACEMNKAITLPNGKKVIAHTLSKAELETISDSNKRIGYLSSGSTGWYWTSTPSGSDYAWYVDSGGDFYYILYFGYSSGGGGARLGFHKNEIKKQLLDIE